MSLIQIKQKSLPILFSHTHRSTLNNHIQRVSQDNYLSYFITQFLSCISRYIFQHHSNKCCPEWERTCITLICNNCKETYWIDWSVSVMQYSEQSTHHICVAKLCYYIAMLLMHSGTTLLRHQSLLLNSKLFKSRNVNSHYSSHSVDFSRMRTCY